jgi:hypothetical protein
VSKAENTRLKGAVPILNGLEDSAQQDIYSALVLFDEKSEHLSSSVVTHLVFAIEKKIKIFLILRNALLLKEKIGETDVLANEKSPETFLHAVIANSEGLVGLTTAWKRYNELIEPEKHFSGSVQEISAIRNNQVHTYQRDNRGDYKAILVVAWDLLVTVHKTIRETCEAVKTNPPKATLKIPEPLDKSFHLFFDKYKAPIELEKIQEKNMRWISAKTKPPTRSQFIKANDAGDADYYIEDILCPFCGAENGFTGFEVDHEYPTDKEGDQMLWEEPSFSLGFNHYGCQSCGAFIESISMMELLDANNSDVMPGYMFIDWDINDGLQSIGPAPVDRKGHSDGTQVFWW